MLRMRTICSLDVIFIARARNVIHRIIAKRVFDCALFPQLRFETELI